MTAVDEMVLIIGKVICGLTLLKGVLINRVRNKR